MATTMTTKNEALYAAYNTQKAACDALNLLSQQWEEANPTAPREEFLGDVLRSSQNPWEPAYIDACHVLHLLSGHAGGPGYENTDEPDMGNDF